VLFRAAHHSARLEIELTRRNIPFVKFGGQVSRGRPRQGLLAVLRWAQNPRDRSGFRAIQLLPGLGPKTAGRILDNVQAAPPGCALLPEQPVPDAARPGWIEFAGMVEPCAATRLAGPLERIAQWYEPAWKPLDDHAVRQADIQQLARIAATYPSRERFLTELTLDPPDATSDESGAPARRGLPHPVHHPFGQGPEWPAVSILNTGGRLPALRPGHRQRAEIEEEMRLLYVAMTRARDHLDLLIPQRFYVSGQAGSGDRHVYASRSRFIPNRLLPTSNRSPGPSRIQTAARDETRQAAVDLAAKMRAMWD
jgi:DNA helicase-2/ATP-dependent DNA helicase PcrA